MPNLLAFDMSMHACSVALMQGDRVVSTFELAARQQSRHILSMIKNLLSESECSYSQLDAVSFGCGPGSFTGVRLSASVAQAIAFSANLPVIPVSTMQAMAQGVYEELGADRTLIVLNAYAGDVYTGLYQKEAASIVQSVAPERRCPPEEVEIDEKVNVIAGDGWDAYPDVLGGKLPSEIKRYENDYTHAKDIIKIASHAFEMGHYVSAEEALPAYLHRESMWKKI